MFLLFPGHNATGRVTEHFVYLVGREQWNWPGREAGVVCISLNAFGLQVTAQPDESGIRHLRNRYLILAPVDNHTWSLNEEEEPKQLASA